VIHRLSRYIEVNILWATRHDWAPQQAITNKPVLAPGLWLVEAGVVELTIHGAVYRVLPGEALLFPDKTPRTVYTPQRATWLSLGLETNFLGLLDPLHTLPLPIQWHPSPEEFATLSHYAAALIHERSIDDAVGKLNCSGLGRLVLGHCYRSLSRQIPQILAREHVPDWFMRMIEEYHLHPDYSVVELAQRAGYSLAQFRRLFHQWAGMSPHDYQTRQRVELAKRLLLTTDLSVTAISERLGYDSLAHFSRLFKQAVGVPPSRYRQAIAEQQV
jgi:AraC-like DNA-binding protein